MLVLVSVPASAVSLGDVSVPEFPAAAVFPPISGFPARAVFPPMSGFPATPGLPAAPAGPLVEPPFCPVCPPLVVCPLSPGPGKPSSDEQPPIEIPTSNAPTAQIDKPCLGFIWNLPGLNRLLTVEHLPGPEGAPQLYRRWGVRAPAGPNAIKKKDVTRVRAERQAEARSWQAGGPGFRHRPPGGFSLRGRRARLSCAGPACPELPSWSDGGRCRCGECWP